MNTLDCICPKDIAPGGYALGCPYHIQQELDRGRTIVRDGWTSVTVTYYQARVTVSTPVLHDGAVWSQQEHISCEHNHTTPGAAEACAEKLARKAVKR